MHGCGVETQPFQKHDDDREALAALAHDVLCSPATPVLDRADLRALTARDAARAMIGVAGWVARRVGVDAMQERMSLLVRHEPAWETNLHDMPVGYDGRVDEYVALIAVVVSGLLPLFGVARVRSAMAFWATERDSSVWQQIAA